MGWKRGVSGGAVQECLKMLRVGDKLGEPTVSLTLETDADFQNKDDGNDPEDGKRLAQLAERIRFVSSTNHLLRTQDLAGRQ